MNRKTGIILSGIVGVVAGLWVWSAVIPKDSIQIGGSTSVSNVMTNLESAYKTYQEKNPLKDKDGKDIKPDSFLYSSVGSAGGINSAKSGTYKMGFISKNLDSSVNYVTTDGKSSDLLTKNIKDRQQAIYDYLSSDKDQDAMHYVQIANDAIIIVYQAPEWFTDNYQINIEAPNGVVSDKSKELIKKIYDGHYKWSEVAKLSELKEGMTAPDLTKVKDDEVQPFAGAAGSGTRTVFDQKFDLVNDDLAQTIPSVGPSDGFMYSSINKNTIGYLSMNYLPQVVENNAMQTVLVNGKNPKDKSFVTDGKFDSEYSLTRPYTGLFKANSSDSDLKKLANFLGWIADAKANSPEGKIDDKSSAAYQYKSAMIEPDFKLDDPDLIKDIKKDNSSKKSDDNSSPTNDELKETIMKGYVKEH